MPCPKSFNKKTTLRFICLVLRTLLHFRSVSKSKAWDKCASVYYSMTINFRSRETVAVKRKPCVRCFVSACASQAFHGSVVCHISWATYTLEILRFIFVRQTDKRRVKVKFLFKKYKRTFHVKLKRRLTIITWTANRKITSRSNSNYTNKINSAIYCRSF